MVGHAVQFICAAQHLDGRFAFFDQAANNGWQEVLRLFISFCALQKCRETIPRLIHEFAGQTPEIHRNDRVAGQMRPALAAVLGKARAVAVFFNMRVLDDANQLVRRIFRADAACNMAVLRHGIAQQIADHAIVILAAQVVIDLLEALDECIRKHLKECRNFEQLLDAVNEELRRRAVATVASVGNLWMEPAPYQSVLMDGCIERGFDISQGAKYNNYGIHGTGVSDAVDQLAAMNDLIFEHRKMTAEDFLLALENNFANNADLLNYLRTQTPKMGRNYEVEPIAEAVLNAFADAFAGLKNERGGIFRPGTGSAMYYVWHAKNAGMLADGHKPGENFAANFSPSLLVTDAGLLSVVKGFSCKALPRVCNGGPLTLELHDTVFRNNDGMKKVAQLVRTFILLGGHQLQLNAVSRETLLDAKKHPERHQDLIVRVWGWSGRFVRLDPEYQDQIIARTSYQSV